MIELNYLNKNEYTADPLVSNPTYLSVERPEWIVDFNAILGSKARWQYADSFKLTSISTVTGKARLVFTAVADDGTTTTFTFDFASGDGEYATQTVYADQGSSFGQASLSVGNLATALFSLVSPLTFAIDVIKTKIHTLYNHTVQTLNVANAWSTIYADSACLAPVSLNGDYKVEVTSLNGDVLVEAGQHVLVAVIENTNEIEFSTIALRSAIGDIPCASQRVLPSGYNTANEPNCSTIFSTINGISADGQSNVFTIQGSPGITVSSVANSYNALNVLFDAATLFNFTNQSSNCAQASPFNTVTYNCSY